MRRVVRCVPVTQTRTVCSDKGHWEEQPADCCSASCGGCEDSCATPCGEEDPCGCCSARRSGRHGLLARRCAWRAPCCAPTKVWVPNVVQDEVEVTVMQRQCVDVPYTYTVTVCTPETRTRMVKRCSYRPEIRTRTVRVCRYDRKTRTRTRQVTQCKLETRTRDVNYTAWVPQTRTTPHKITTYKCVPAERVQQYTVMVPHQVQKEVQVRVCRMVPKTIQVPSVTCCDARCGRAKYRRVCRSRGC
jgi:hypothetical protein